MPWLQYVFFCDTADVHLSTGRISVMLETWTLQFRQKKNPPEYMESIETLGKYWGFFVIRCSHPSMS